MKTAKDYRAQALETLRGNWKQPVLATLVLYAIFYVPYVPYMFFTSGNRVSSTLSIVLSLVFMVFLFAVYLPISMAYYGAMLRNKRGSQGVLDNVCDIFRGRYARITGIGLRMVVVVLLMMIPIGICAGLASVGIVKMTGLELSSMLDKQSAEFVMFVVIMTVMVLLFCIPMYIYCLAVTPTFFMHEDEQEMRIGEMFARSRQMMKGHKWQLFCLYLSFIGWYLLAVLTLGIGNLWLTPYVSTALAHFYEDVRAQDEEK